MHSTEHAESREIQTHLEILTKLPSTTLLLSPSGTVMCEIGVGIIVEESRHNALMEFLGRVPITCYIGEKRERSVTEEKILW